MRSTWIHSTTRRLWGAVSKDFDLEEEQEKGTVFKYNHTMYHIADRGHSV